MPDNKVFLNKINKDLYGVYVNGKYLGSLESYWDKDNKLWEFISDISEIKDLLFNNLEEAKSYFRNASF